MLVLIPNLITVARIALVPVLILALREDAYDFALVIFIVAGVSDAVDGFIAKRFHLESRLGAILDPAADKLLLVTMYAMLAMAGDIPFWLMLTVVFRDFLIVGGYLLYTSMLGPVHMHPSMLSKFNTFMQLTLIVVVLSSRTFGWGLDVATDTLSLAVLVTTVASGIHYLWSWIIRHEVEVDRQRMK